MCGQTTLRMRRSDSPRAALSYKDQFVARITRDKRADHAADARPSVQFRSECRENVNIFVARDRL